MHSVFQQINQSGILGHQVKLTLSNHYMEKSRYLLKWFCNASNDRETNLFAVLQHITGKTHHRVD